MCVGQRRQTINTVIPDAPCGLQNTNAEDENQSFKVLECIQEQDEVRHFVVAHCHLHRLKKKTETFLLRSWIKGKTQ